MFSIILAALINLAPGFNNIGQSGEVVAVNAATAEAAATVNLQTVSTFTTYSNIVDEVVSYETAWRVTVTNSNPRNGYSLSDDCFPIVATAQTNGMEYVYTSSDIVILTPPDALDAYILPRDFSDPVEDCLASFYNPITSGMSAYLVAGPRYSTLLFGGVEPTTDTWPTLIYTADPATYVTNVVGYVDYSAFTDTNGVSTIIGEPVRFDMPITNTVVTATVPAETYAQTNTLATVATTNHFGSATVGSTYIFGGGIYVDGAAEGDRINILLK